MLMPVVFWCPAGCIYRLFKGRQLLIVRHTSCGIAQKGLAWATTGLTVWPAAAVALAAGKCADCAAGSVLAEWLPDKHMPCMSGWLHGVTPTWPHHNSGLSHRLSDCPGPHVRAVMTQPLVAVRL